MREIKFRARLNKNDYPHSYECGWIYGFVSKDTKGIWYMDTLGNDGKLIGDGRYVSVGSETICQFTGLKDKNGREIYEGDIVKSATQNNIIKFEYGSFTVMGLHEDKYEREYSMLYHFLVDATIPNEKHSKFDGVTTTLEVIGNIYENPELLEGEE